MSWMPPYLTLLLDDPYDAVRFIAGRSLQSFPSFTEFTYDFVASRQQRLTNIERALAMWRRAKGAGQRTDTPLLLDDNGALQYEEWRRLLRQRDDRRVRLIE